MSLTKSPPPPRPRVDRVKVAELLASLVIGHIRERCLLHGGDDYELLFTLPPASLNRVPELARAGGCELNAPVVHQTQNTNAVGFTALHLLAKPHHKWTGEQLDDVLALMEALLEQGASPDSELPGTGRTPLSLAATAGQEEVAVLLVKHGVDPASPERDGSSVFARCRSGRQMPMLKALEEACRRRSRAAENQRARR